MDSPAISYRAFRDLSLPQPMNPNVGFKKCEILNQSLSEAIRLNDNDDDDTMQRCTSPNGDILGLRTLSGSSKLNFSGQSGLGYTSGMP